MSAEELLAGKYRVAGRLGEGGMGVVYAGEHVELGTRVAIKVLQPSLAEDATARARFLREARLAASIEGEHSTRIHDVGTDEHGRPYMVMEQLAGETAAARLEREGRLPLALAATVMLQLLDTLAEAHAKRLVHRDLKPANLFLAQRTGEEVWVKVLDFGISKVRVGGDDKKAPSLTLTEPRALLGSPEYMSPEQLRDSANVDARSDIWACGVVLFELLTGSMPFEGPTLADLCAQIVSREPRDLAQVASEARVTIPAGLARVVERCLRKNPADRPQNAYELAVALAPFATESGRALVPRIRAWCNGPALDDVQPKRSRRVMFGGISLVVGAGALAFAVASLRTPAAVKPATAAVPSLEPLPGPPPVRAAAPAEPTEPAATAALRDAGAADVPGDATREAPREAPSAPATGTARAIRSPKGTPDKKAGGRIQDLASIELIE